MVRDTALLSRLFDDSVTNDEISWLLAQLQERKVLSSASTPEEFVKKLTDALFGEVELVSFDECTWEDLASTQTPTFVHSIPTLSEIQAWFKVHSVDEHEIILSGADGDIVLRRRNFLDNWDRQCLTITRLSERYPKPLWVALAGRRFVSRPDDIFISTYPKSGTTFCQTLVCRLISPERLAAGEILHDISPYFEATEEKPTAALYADLPSPRCFKSHASICWLPPGARYIAMVRAPGSILASYARHRLTHEEASTWDEAIKKSLWDFRSPHPGAWREHFLCNLSLGARKDAMLLRYAEATQNTGQIARELADFLGHECSQEEIAAAVSLSSLKHMKDNWQHFSPTINGIQTAGFFGEGAASEWHSITAQGAAACLEEVEAVLKAAGRDEDDPELAFLKLGELRELANSDRI